MSDPQTLVTHLLREDSLGGKRRFGCFCIFTSYQDKILFYVLGGISNILLEFASHLGETDVRDDPPLLSESGESHRFSGPLLVPFDSNTRPKL